MKYSIIYADPPWEYRNKKTGGTMCSGSSDKYKSTMTVEEICNLPILSICEHDAVLFLWATTPMKWEAFDVMKAWGFKYKTTIYWHKMGIFGIGFWFRGQVEELLVGVRGSVKAFRLQQPNIISAKVLRHSEKPKEFRELIKRATAKMQIQTRVELFARCNSDGWDVFGNEVKDSIELPHA